MPVEADLSSDAESQIGQILIKIDLNLLFQEIRLYEIQDHTMPPLSFLEVLFELHSIVSVLKGNLSEIDKQILKI